MATTLEDPDRPTLTGEDLDRIRARMLARVNLGVDPTSPAFLDAIPGSIFADLEGPAALALDEAYDYGDVVARAVIPTTSFGSWLDDWALSVGLERREAAHAGGVVTFTGTPAATISTGQQVTTTTGPDGDPIAFQVDAGGTVGGGGTVDLAVTAVIAGSAGNAQAGTVTIPTPTIAGVTAVTNATAMTGGADVESDELLNERVREAMSGELGAGNIADYVRWLKQIPGIGFVTVRPHARGPGTVDAYITDLNNDPMPGAAVTNAQNIMDPVAGEGLGVAPIGHDADILTPGTFAVTVAATVTHESGYSLDGAGGTRATRAIITAAIRRYIDGLDVGADVLRNKVIAAIVDVIGVANVTTSGGSSMQINTSTSDVVAVPAGDVAASSTITLT
jgi:uncharacterized phage protein gp47/JayE